MPRLILLVAVIVLLYLLLRRAKARPPHLRRAEYIKLALIAVLAVAIFLAATGRMHWIGAAFTALLVAARQSLPLLLRLFPMLAARARGSKPASAGQTSTVETALLRMRLDHDSGELQGEVLKGSFQGWRLADMDRRQLEQFMAYCKREDDDSLQLLDSYWQQRFPGEAFVGGHAGAPPGEAPAMGRNEALSVLGLSENATREDIIEAHRKLIQKVHPDRGGNDYLAAQINRARDVLLA